MKILKNVVSFLLVVGRIEGISTRHCPKAVAWNEPRNNPPASPGLRHVQKGSVEVNQVAATRKTFSITTIIMNFMEAWSRFQNALCF